MTTFLVAILIGAIALFLFGELIFELLIGILMVAGYIIAGIISLAIGIFGGACDMACDVISFDGLTDKEKQRKATNIAGAATLAFFIFLLLLKGFGPQ